MSSSFDKIMYLSWLRSYVILIYYLCLYIRIHTKKTFFFYIQIIRQQRKLVLLLVAEIQRIQSGSDSAQFVVVYELLIAIDYTPCPKN